MVSPNATPTPITPPRVPLLDDRTGLISRQWYLFFLSLYAVAQSVVDSGDTGPNAASLIASVGDALRALAQSTDTKPQPVADLEIVKQIDAAASVPQPSAVDAEITKQLDAAASVPQPSIAELQQQIDLLRQELWTLRLPELAAYVAFGGPAALTTLSASGTVSLTGTAQRITGDMSNATFANRLAFQTSTTNGNTTISVLPNGTATISLIAAFNNSDPTNGSYIGLLVTSAETRVQSTRLGTGTFLPLKFYTSGVEQASVDTSGNFRVGTAALATTATDGFLYIPTCAGTPTGVPTAITGLAPMVIDSTNNKLYFYSGGVWRDAGP